MKKMFLIMAALIGLLVSCDKEPVDDGPKTTIVFINNNPVNSCVAVVYDDVRRRDEDIIAEVPARESSREIEWQPGSSVPFYFSYRVNLKDIKDFTVDYLPREMGVGKDQTLARINANEKTTINIPNLSETISSSDALLTDKCYIVIKNNSSASFRLQSGSASITPDNLTTSLVNPGEQANYTIAPGPASAYKLLVSPDEIPLSGVSAFEAGHVYIFHYSGNNYNVYSQAVKIALENVDMVSPNVPGAPGAPTGVTATAISPSSITVNWDSVSGAAGYRVYRGTSSSGSYSFRGESTSTSYTDTGLSASTLYYYKVSAYNNIWETALSSSDVFAPTFSSDGKKAAGAAVSAPTRKSVTKSSDGYITVTLNAVSAPGNGQTVEYATSLGGDYVVSAWRDELTFRFDGQFYGGRTFYFYARSKENANYDAGEASAGTAITFPY